LSYGFAGTYVADASSRWALRLPLGAFRQIAATTAMALSLVLLIDQALTAGSTRHRRMGSLAGLVLLSTASALIATAGATSTSLVTLLIPASAILLGAAFLGERLPMSQAGGMTLIGLGLLVLDGRISIGADSRMGDGACLDRMPDGANLRGRRS
jgi:drug/metabolite transporter (DMT)-like permease